MATEKRTDEEIVLRIREVQEKDFLGFRQGVLVHYLGYADAVQFIREDEDGVPVVSREDWEATEMDPPAAAGAEYLPFAFEKIENERGISAERSVQKLSEWAWLDGETELSSRMDSPENYGNYGDQAVKLYAEHYGVEWPIPDEEPS